MRAGKYSFKELFVNRYVDQLIVPEIQRDYVWQKGQLLGFLSSIKKEFQEFQEAEIPEIAVDTQSDSGALLQKDFEDFFRKRNFSANIGFIYAYSDEQYQGRYFLIDGQQRITSLYLLLLTLASRCGQEQAFRKHYCRAGRPLLDYRVRDATSYFLGEVVETVLQNPEIKVEDQAWYLDSYSEDTSIRTMLDNLKSISGWLEESELSEQQFFDYIQNQTEFWYFDTNISAQGENLYIYLNARGEQVQSNENLKADLLSKLETDSEKNKWGKKWEHWQDVFWSKRKIRPGKPNSNADEGFNGFLLCIASLKQYLSGDRYQSSADNSASAQPLTSVLSNILKLDEIEKYIRALEYLDDHKEQFQALYPYSGWLERCLEELWSIWNRNATDWFIDYSKPDVYSTQTNQMVFTWGILHWVDLALEREMDVEQFYRGLRPFFLRYHNNVRAASQVKESVQNLLDDGFVTKEETSEEYQREHWLRSIGDIEDRRHAESVLWELEDHRWNLDGSDVGAINITHLLAFDSDLSLKKLKAVRDAFWKCFPSTSSDRELQSLLLHYGQYWQRKSPYYYENYRFDDWKTIIRGSPHRGIPQNDVFHRCLYDVIEAGTDISTLLAEKRGNFSPDINAADLQSQLLWYNHFLKESMWRQGSFIAIGDGSGKDEADEIFPDKQAFRNTKGDFKGGNPEKLSEMLPPEVKKNLRR